MPKSALNRRTFLAAGISIALSAAPDQGYYRLEQINGIWRIVAPDRAPIERAPPISTVPRTTPFFAAVPLIPDNSFADVFDETFQDNLRARCAALAGIFVENRLAAAYVFTAVPAWSRDWVSWTRVLDPESPGKQQYLQFLKQTYSYNIELLTSTYGIESTSFTDLGAYPWAGLDASRPAVRKDDDAFLGWIAQVLFSTAAEALRKRDLNHLITGPAFAPGLADGIILAAAASLDAIWLDPHANPPPELVKPVLRFIG